MTLGLACSAIGGLSYQTSRRLHRRCPAAANVTSDMLRMRMSGENYTQDTATLGADPEGDTSVTLSSALLVTPRWVRDGGVGAHVQASAALLAREGLEIHVL